MDLGLRGRVAAVAAASKGLGRACAEAFAREGADVAICARGPQALNETAAHLGSLGSSVLAVPCDLAEPGAAEAFVASAVERFGRLDILVTNIGGPPSGTHETYTLDDLRGALERNLLAAVRLSHAALPHMKQNGFGRIINIASIAAKEPIEALMIGNAARAGILGWAKTLSREVARDGVTVNTIAPGIFMTDRMRELAAQRAEREGIDIAVALAAMASSPVGRTGTPEEFGALAAFLASKHAGYITGTTIAIDGGLSRALF